MATTTTARRKAWDATLHKGTTLVKCTHGTPCALMIAALATKTTLWKNLLSDDIGFQPFPRATVLFLSVCPFCGGRLVK